MYSQTSVVSIVQNTVAGDGQKTYTFVEKEKQQAALKFLLDEVLTYPEMAVRHGSGNSTPTAAQHSRWA